jgi:preprotein translocase subunit SecG
MNETLLAVLALLGGLFAIISLLVYVNNRNKRRDADKDKQ